MFAVVGGSPATCGKFLVDGVTADVTSVDGLINYGTSAVFTLDAANTLLGGAFPAVGSATEFFVTVEADGDAIAAPSELVVLAGSASSGSANLTVVGLSATGGRGLADFVAAAGTFIVRTPTNDATGVA